MALSRQKAVLGAFVIAAGLPAWPAAAIDLLGSYEKALANAAQVRMARARADAGREALPQASAQLLPNVTLNYAYGYTEQRRTLDNVTQPTQHYPSRSGTMGLRQPIFRKDLLSQYEEAKAKVRGAEAQLDASYQSIGLRVTAAYFDALYARDSLELILSQKSAYEAQLRAAMLAYTAGAGTRTDVEDIQSRLHLLLADEIKARQAVAASREQLEIYVGETISHLSTLDSEKFDATAHDPSTLDSWIGRAMDYSPELRVLKAQHESALSGVEKSRAGHYPTLDLLAQAGSSTGDSTDAFPRTEKITSYVGVQLSVPIFTGGYVSSAVRQSTAVAEEARFAYEHARDELRFKVKREFDGVMAQIARIGALDTALRSAQQVVLSSQKGVQAGTRTTVDVLIATQQRFNTQVDLAGSRYQLLVGWATLQSYVGDLDAAQIARINRLLTGPVPVPM